MSTTKGRTKRDIREHNIIDDTVDKANASDAITTLTGIYANIYVIRKEMEYLKRPMGTKENPARSCKDLFLAHTEFQNGWYWIDPNLGVPDDAIKVYCDLASSGDTCLYADEDTSQAPVREWRKPGDRKEVAFSELNGGFRISYSGVNSVQLRFLRLLSRTAYQNFTYTCENSVAWFSEDLKDYSLALQFIAANDERFTPLSYRPSISLDQCQGGRGQSVFQFKTSKTEQLPLADFIPKDFVKQGQKFGFKLGPVCFN